MRWSLELGLLGTEVALQLKFRNNTNLTRVKHTSCATQCCSTHCYYFLFGTKKGIETLFIQGEVFIFPCHKNI